MSIFFFAVKSEQVSSSVFQEQNVTDLITSSYGVGPTDDNGRPLFGLRALRKTNTNQSLSGKQTNLLISNACETALSAMIHAHDNIAAIFLIKYFLQKTIRFSNKSTRAVRFRTTKAIRCLIENLCKTRTVIAGQAHCNSRGPRCNGR